MELSIEVSQRTRQNLDLILEVAGNYNAAFEYLLSLRETKYKTGKPFAELVAMELVYKNGAVYNYELRKTTGCGAAVCKAVAASYKDEPLILEGTGKKARLYFRLGSEVADQLTELLSYTGDWERLCSYLLSLQKPRFDKGSMHAERVLKQMVLHGEKVTSYALNMECTNASLHSATKVFNDYKSIIAKLESSTK